MTQSQRRCQPWLGTLVEISVTSDYAELAAPAISKAYAEIARVHQCMSLFEPKSELCRLNASAFAEDFIASALLRDVLKLALQLAHASAGAFDPTADKTASGDFIYVQQDGPNVRFDRPLRLDLNGIAKGYAVDLAIAALQTPGISNAVVNAGGDLRVFGQAAVEVQLRHPSSGALGRPGLRLCNQALATSGGTLHWRTNGSGRRRPTIISARGGFRGSASVSVIAATAAVADALTKVALLAHPSHAAEVLRQFGATAHFLEAN